MVRKTSDLKINFLGWIPRFEDQFLDTQSIIAFSALLTFKGKPIKALYKEAIEKEQNVRKKVKTILSKSSLRGHASLSTTPVLAISFQGSKFLDSMLTGIVFASSLMASGRRTETQFSDIVYPKKILAKKTLFKLYTKQSEKNIKFVNLILDKGIPKDEVTKALQYGIVGTGIMALPIESIIGFEREWEEEREWMPEDGCLFLTKIKKKLKKFGLDDLYHTRKVAPRNVYPYPNIFKDPKESNLARDFGKKLKPGRLSKIVDFQNYASKDLKKRLIKLEEKIVKMVSSKTKIKRKWPSLLKLRKQICRDYNPCLSLSVVSAVSWRVWGEKKRHRTVPQVVDSIYHSVNQTLKIFKKAYPKIKSNGFGQRLLPEINQFFPTPPLILSNKDILRNYLTHVAESLFTYEKLVKMGAPPREAIYIIPRGIRILVLQKFDLYNLVSGYYPLRLCPTAEELMRRMTEEEYRLISRLFKRRKLSWLLSLIVPKCHLVGFCPEPKFCGKIRRQVPFYTEKFHQEMKENLKERFLESIKVST